MKIGLVEELILLAVRQLSEESTGTAIGEVLEFSNHDIAVGTLYITLSRLEKKKLIKGRQGVPLPERGGKSRRYFHITGEGRSILDETESLRSRVQQFEPITKGAQ